MRLPKVRPADHINIDLASALSSRFVHLNNFDFLDIFHAAHLGNTSVLSELCATLSRLAVRNEFCQDICDMGGLKLMMTLLADSYESAVTYKKQRS